MILRRELRLEVTVGYALQLRNRVSFLLGLEPYWVVAADRQARPDYRETWGFVLVFRTAAFWVLHRAPASGGGAEAR